MPLSRKVIKAYHSLNHSGSTKINTELRFDDLIEKASPTVQHSERDLYTERMERLLEEAKTEKEQLLAAAHEEASRIREVAQEEGYQTGQQQGLEAGYQAGYQAGHTEATAEAEQLQQEARQMLEESAAQVQAYYTEKRAEIIELAAQMAERIVHEKIDTSEERLLPLIMPVLSRMEQENKFITITVTPELVKEAKEKVKTLETEFPLFRFAVLADPALEKNGCVIETPHAIADLQIKQQLDAMVEDLKELQVADHV